MNQTQIYENVRNKIEDVLNKYGMYIYDFTTDETNNKLYISCEKSSDCSLCNTYALTGNNEEELIKDWLTQFKQFLEEQAESINDILNDLNKK